MQKNPRQVFIRAFEVKILSNLGFISFQSSTPGMSTQFQSGSVGSKLLSDLENNTWDQIEKMEINQKEALELDRILRYHIERVLESSLKSRKFLKNL